MKVRKSVLVLNSLSISHETNEVVQLKHYDLITLTEAQKSLNAEFNKM
jgi:hypothetical protein